MKYYVIVARETEEPTFVELEDYSALMAFIAAEIRDGQGGDIFPFYGSPVRITVPPIRMHVQVEDQINGEEMPNGALEAPADVPRIWGKPLLEGIDVDDAD